MNCPFGLAARPERPQVSNMTSSLLFTSYCRDSSQILLLPHYSTLACRFKIHFPLLPFLHTQFVNIIVDPKDTTLVNLIPSQLNDFRFELVTCTFYFSGLWLKKELRAADSRKNGYSRMFGHPMTTSQYQQLSTFLRMHLRGLECATHNYSFPDVGRLSYIGSF